MKLQYSFTWYFYQCIWKISWFMAFCYITITISWNHFHGGASLFLTTRGPLSFIFSSRASKLFHILWGEALCFASTFNAFPFGSIFCSQENKVLALLHPPQSMERSACLSNLGSLEEIPALDTMFQAQFSIALETAKMGWPEPTAIRDNLGSLEVDWKSEKVSRPNSSKRTIGREDPRRMEEGLRRGGKRVRSHGDSQQTPCCFSF